VISQFKEAPVKPVHQAVVRAQLQLLACDGACRRYMQCSTARKFHGLPHIDVLSRIGLRPCNTRYHQERSGKGATTLRAIPATGANVAHQIEVELVERCIDLSEPLRQPLADQACEDMRCCSEGLGAFEVPQRGLQEPVGGSRS
jgi:hypothetical protein